jgi:hypothetical protein
MRRFGLVVAEAEPQELPLRRVRKTSKLLIFSGGTGIESQFRLPYCGSGAKPTFRIAELLSEFCPKTTPDQARFAYTNQEARV